MRLTKKASALVSVGLVAAMALAACSSNGSGGTKSSGQATNSAGQQIQAAAGANDISPTPYDQVQGRWHTALPGRRLPRELQQLRGRRQRVGLGRPHDADPAAGVELRRRRQAERQHRHDGLDHRRPRPARRPSSTRSTRRRSGATAPRSPTRTSSACGRRTTAPTPSSTSPPPPATTTSSPCRAAPTDQDVSRRHEVAVPGLAVDVRPDHAGLPDATPDRVQQDRGSTARSTSARSLRRPVHHRQDRQDREDHHPDHEPEVVRRASRPSWTRSQFIVSTVSAGQGVAERAGRPGRHRGDPAATSHRQGHGRARPSTRPVARTCGTSTCR